jgi:hypothetical protein
MDDVALLAFSDNTLRWLCGGAREQRLLQARPLDFDSILFASSPRTLAHRLREWKNPSR